MIGSGTKLNISPQVIIFSVWIKSICGLKTFNTEFA